MQLDKGLVKVEKSSHYGRYLLIIGILALAFSLSFMIRAQPLEYGFELNEYDPFFNYRATQFVVENGLPSYLEWHDDLSWHPYGRDISTTSQVMLHVTAATLYQIFGMGSSLYDFTILFPMVIGSLTVVVIFAIVRTIGGTTAGLFASLFFAVSPIIIMRGSIGWFKSEPLGLFYGLLAVYLLISGIKSDKGKISIAKVVGSGILLAFGVDSWGGAQFFILPIGLFFVLLPFMRKDNKFIIWTSVLFVSVFVLVSVSFDKILFWENLPFFEFGFLFISSLTGFFIIGCTTFLIACVIIKRIVSKAQLRSGLALLGGAIIAGIALVSSGIINLPSFRYLNATNPLLITTDMLTDSVSEHATTTIDISFYFFSILMVFAGLGAWLLFQKKVNRSLPIKGEMAAFALIIGFLGIYFSSAFVRLEVFGSISVIILSSIGISILISKILKAGHKPTNAVTKISFLAIIVALLMVPMVYPETNWTNNNKGLPITILNSGSHFNTSTNDWSDAMQWLRENTPEDAVIASWWDYGYWISTLAERKTLADNSTLLDWQIRKIAAMYMSTPEDAWRILTSDTDTNVGSHYVTLPSDISKPTRQGDDIYDENVNKLDKFKSWKDRTAIEKIYDPEIAEKYPTLFDYWESEVYTLPPILTGLDADYVIINLAAEKLSAENIMDLYALQQKGGDETKAFWFLKIADLNIFDYYNPELSGYSSKFWDETLLGKLIPFTHIVYVDTDNPEIQSETFKPGYTSIYVKNIKFPMNEDGPFQLVYVPPSFEMDAPGPLTGPLIYKINKEYNPNQ
uniref:dolichyl-phosphooligosaccharide-protein glycotransferase n=1 Tax=uncultured marine thaumarchaeote KM3_82_A11 TaxID=1456301 RepID=A0A075HUN4_9ARCH|nr:putative membrane protein required for N-linked glycosylation (STT3) [uncultured marine thaumarchaeote KM3_82_A11]